MSETKREDRERPDDGTARRAALRLEDWSAPNAVLNRGAIEKLRRAGWITFFGALTRRDLQSPALDGGADRVTAAQASAIKENLLSYHARSPATEQAKLSAASRELCEFFGVDLRASPPSAPAATDRGGWVLYKNGRVALFLEASAYPDPINPKFPICGPLLRQIRSLDFALRLSRSEGEIGQQEEWGRRRDLARYFPEPDNRGLEFFYSRMSMSEATGRVGIYLSSFEIVTDFGSVSFEDGRDINPLVVEIDGDYEIRFRDGSSFRGKRLQAKLWMERGEYEHRLDWQIALYDEENVRREFDNGDNAEFV